MTHLFDKAVVRREDGKSWLCLRVKNAPMARSECGQLKPGKVYSAEIKLHREKRSGRANAYAWVLMDRLAAATGQPKMEIYRGYIPDVGGNAKTLCIGDEDARNSYAALWETQGCGFVAQDMGGGVLVCYYGSSTYDTAQMSRLIDLIVFDCKDNGIETDTPEQLARMMQDWKPEARLL